MEFVHRPMCECLPNRGLVGDQCNIPICYGKTAEDPLVCSGNGSCIAPNNCSFIKGRTGLRYELNICFGRSSSDHSVCSGHGSSRRPNGGGYIGGRCVPQNQYNSHFPAYGAISYNSGSNQSNTAIMEMVLSLSNF